jgi:hypothetical protein
MKRKMSAGLLAAVLVASLTGCVCGPSRLSRTWNDYVNQKYSENAWIHGAVLQEILPVYGLVGFVAAFGDLFANIYYFWSEDAFDNRGTAFEHDPVEGAVRTVKGSGLE